MTDALGDFIGGELHAPRGQALRSFNPTTGGIAFETRWDLERVNAACDAASRALPAWRDRTRADRVEILGRFREAIKGRRVVIADAIVLETGKLRSEALSEVDSLVARFELVAKRIDEDMPGGPLAGFAAESVRHHPHGVVGVIGPYNFPLHLCHAHVVPALMLGNTVVVKPSEIAPLSAQRYAEAALEAKLPEGIFNIVQGPGEAGDALISSKHLRALCFTGSWATGRRILERMLDRPEVLVALEMGGKNTVVVLDDADLRQAAHEIVVGGYLTAGQRCTCTERVLVHASVRDKLLRALVPLVASMRFGDPEDPRSFAGPMATSAGRDRIRDAWQRAQAAGAQEVARGSAPEAGFFAPATLHLLPNGKHQVDGYTDAELFGPDVHLETVASDEEAIELLNGSTYGFANAIFGGSRARFERFYRETTSGILNWNRSTNLASPRLPFGGTGRSGNFRPAGSYAARNLAIPVAVQENRPGGVVEHPLLAPHLVPHDLDRLEHVHHAEEIEESQRDLLAAQRPLAVRRPKGGRLPKSEGWLQRLYAGDRLPKEKKPGVFDHQRSVGPWFVSVDDEPLSVLDAMSQTATVVGGFAEDPVVRRYVEGGFGDTIEKAYDTSLGDDPHAQAYADRLRQLVPGLPYVTFTNSGAEACEKAIALCRNQAKHDKQRKVLAFEGSFHGRTLLSLHASHNPSKRAPFELPGYEVTFVPFPVWHDVSEEPEPPAPDGFLGLVSRGKLSDCVEYGEHDPLLAMEIASLNAVHEQLSSGEYFVVMVEPMQSEGGDRYGTKRFHRALRLLTRQHGVPLVVDEVQCGFGLGGTFAWHTRFGYLDRGGDRDFPDCVTFAKRAQVGIVMSRYQDPEPTSAHGASLVRGLVHLEMMADDHYVDQVEDMVQTRLEDLQERYPQFIANPRVTGYAFAFDLPTPELLNAYLEQRFWRGAIVFGAGSRTVRYRLSTAFGEAEIELLFTTIRQSLSWLDANPNQKPPLWQNLEEPRPKSEPSPELRIVPADKTQIDRVIERLVELEARVYEPARRDSPEMLRLALDDKDGIALLAETRVVSPEGEQSNTGEWKLVGACLGAPLERVEAVAGPDRSPLRGRARVLYALATTVDPDFRGVALGTRLKKALLTEAKTMRRPDGTPRYHHVSGRNRVGRTAAMGRINRAHGAYDVYRLTGQYGDPDAQALYYQLPLGPFVVDAAEQKREPKPFVDMASGISAPFASAPPSLVEAGKLGLLYGPSVNKITICNYVTPGIVRAVEWIAAMTPRLPHLYLTSSRDETFDKCIRSLRFHRKGAIAAIGLSGGYVGHTTAAARSLSDPAVQRQGKPHFDEFVRVGHPAKIGLDAWEAELRRAIEALGGASRVLGFFIEPVQERTGRVLPEGFYSRLEALREELGLPVVLVETASAHYRSGRGPFFSSGLTFLPDLMTWWGGGQIGFVHLAPRFYIASPLTMVSTWDGDELSLVRVHHQLRAARRVDVAVSSAALDGALAPLRDAGKNVYGEGLYRVADFGAGAAAFVTKLTSEGFRARAYPNDHVAFAPPLDLAKSDIEKLAAAIKRAL